MSVILLRQNVLDVVQAAELCNHYDAVSLPDLVRALREDRPPAAADAGDQDPFFNLQVAQGNIRHPGFLADDKLQRLGLAVDDLVQRLDITAGRV